MSLTREQIVIALTRLDEELGALGCRASLHLVGGAVMCLVLDVRNATKDVDAWFTEPQTVRKAAARIANELGLPSDWLNDAAKGFVPEGAGFEVWRRLPNLEILAADDRTLFAMKCAAARTEEDAADIRVLAQRLGLKKSEEALEIVLAYSPRSGCQCARGSYSRSSWMTTAVDCLNEARNLGDEYQLAVNQFIDDFRRAGPAERASLVAEPILQQGALEGLIAAVVSSLCRETGTETPEWVGRIGSPEPFFAFPAKSYALRVRLMFESPPAFRIRRVFVPENYLSRA